LQFFPAGAKLEHLKKYIGELTIPVDWAPVDVGGKKFEDVIPTGDFGLHSAQRATPYNMPVEELRENDLPLKFSWHMWSPSYKKNNLGYQWEQTLWEQE
jgi:hypothetical protein